MDVASDRTEIELRGYLDTLARRKWWVIVTVIVAVGLSLAYSYRSAKVYEASAHIAISNPAESLVPGTGAGAPVQNPERYLATQLQLLRSEGVVSEVGKRMGSRARSIQSVTAEPIGRTDIVSVRTTSTSPEVARDAANTYANVYVERQRDQAASALSDNADELRALAKKVDAQGEAADKEIATMLPGSNRDLAVAGRALLTQNAQELRGRADQFDVQAAYLRGAGSQVVTAATLPSTPISPQPLRDAALAGVVGLLLGVGLAFGRDYFDDGVRVEEVDRMFPTVPVLANIPVVDDWRDPASARVVAIDRPHSAAAEAYRSLRTSVEFAGLGHTFKRLLVTSPGPLEGKSTTVANLAVTLAAAGLHVIVVDCDLRRPRQHAFFGLSQAPGITSVLVGHASLDEALQTVPGGAGGRLELLASGPLPPNPSEVLRTARFARVLDELCERADFVIVDSTPVLSVTDALVASRWVDATICVARVGRTTNRRLATAIERLSQSTTPALGLVVNGVTAGASSGTYYYYGEDRRPRGFMGRKAGRRAKRTSTGYATDWQGLVTEKPVANGGRSHERDAQKEELAARPPGEYDRGS